MRWLQGMLWCAATAALTGCAMVADPNDWRPKAEAVTPGTVGSQPLREYQVDLVALLDQALCRSPDRSPACSDAGSIRPSLAGEGEVDAGRRRREAHRAVRRQEYDEYARYLVIADQTGSVEARNTVVSQVVAASVHNCHIYMQSLRGGQVTARTTSDLVTSTMGVAGAVMGPLSTSRALSSLAALSTAYGASWDRNVYADQAAEMVADEIRKLRLTERAALERKYTLSYSAWPMAVALADVAEFHNNCTMLRGLSLIQDAVINRERSVRATRIAAMTALEAGGDGHAVMAAVNGVAGAFLGASDFDAGLTPFASSGFSIGSRDLEAAMSRGRACLADLINAEDGRRNHTAIAEASACRISAEHAWRDQFIAVVVAQADVASAPETLRARALDGLRERRAAIEAGRALYADTLSRGVSLEWNWAMIQRTLNALTSTEAVDGDIAYGPDMLARDPVISAMRRSYEGFLEDSGDRNFSLRGAVSIAQTLANRLPGPPEPGQEESVRPATEPGAGPAGTSPTAPETPET